MGYANFAIAEPSLKLVLIEVPDAERGSGTAGALNHLGVEGESTDEVDVGAARLREAGLAAFDGRDTHCCHALHDKVWVHDPAGTPWEIYTVKVDDLGYARDTSDLPVLQTGMNDGGCCTRTPGASRG